MMKHAPFLTGFLIAAMLLAPVSTYAQASEEPEQNFGASACRDEVNKALAKEHRTHRSVLFGHKKAEEAPVSTVQYDKEGNAWIKVNDKEWRSVAEGFTKTTWSDVQMDGLGELKPRRGIFETKRVMTSQLIPYMTQSLHALQCRTQIICKTVSESIGAEGRTPTTVTIKNIPGCIELEVETFPACHLGATEQRLMDEGDALTYCKIISMQMLEREAQLMKMTVEYDATYRTLLQFAGNFDGFLREWRWMLAGTLRQASILMSSYARIPCFISSCEETAPIF